MVGIKLGVWFLKFFFCYFAIIIYSSVIEWTFANQILDISLTTTPDALKALHVELGLIQDDESYFSQRPLHNHFNETAKRICIVKTINVSTINWI